MKFGEAHQFEEPKEVWLTNLPQIAPFGSSNWRTSPNFMQVSLFAKRYFCHIMSKSRLFFSLFHTIFRCASNGIIHQFQFHVDKKIPFPNLPCSTGHALTTYFRKSSLRNQLYAVREVHLYAPHSPLGTCPPGTQLANGAKLNI
jgi:hypothetical protein